jgi:hypothetical protein
LESWRRAQPGGPNARSLAHHDALVIFRKEHPMMDVIMIAIGLVFFALSVGYVLACDQL